MANCHELTTFIEEAVSLGSLPAVVTRSAHAMRRRRRNARSGLARVRLFAFAFLRLFMRPAGAESIAIEFVRDRGVVIAVPHYVDLEALTTRSSRLQPMISRPVSTRL